MGYPTFLPGVMYTHNEQHRNNNPHKSQWTISRDEELSCFETASTLLYIYGINEGPDCWGLHKENKTVVYLGRTAINSPNSGQELFIAKFIDGNNNDVWHGYPADHVGNQQDIPPASVLQFWLEENSLPVSKIRKITKGQKCKL
jgi:hypothetical protein